LKLRDLKAYNAMPSSYHSWYFPRKHSNSKNN